ncbi:MAG: tetratricopeptide repeat protein [Spirochaetia bacterium]
MMVFSLLPTHLFARSDDPKRVTMDANLLYREHRYADAVGLCQRNHKRIDPRNISLLMDNYTIWQRSLIALERYDEAIEIGMMAQKTSRHDYRIIQALGEAYYLAGQGEQALPYLQRYAALRNSDEYTGRVYYYMGEIYLRQGKYQHADIAFSTAIYHSSNSYRWWYRLGFTREMANNKGGARKAYEQALALNPNFIEVRSRLDAL